MAPKDQTLFLTGPEPALKLRYSDVWLPGLYSRRVLCFKLPADSTHDKVVNVVTRGLTALVEGTPELGATSVVVPNAAEHDKTQPWRALVPGDGIHLVVKDLTKSFLSYQELEATNFPLSSFKDELLMPIATTIMPEPQPQAKFQISLIEGGILLSVCIYHHLTDGNGMNAITWALGEECQKAAMTDGELPPRVLSTDRSIMDSLNGGNTNMEDHPAYGMTTGAFRPDAHHDAAPPEANGEPAPIPPKFRPAYFHLSPTKSLALKTFATDALPISTHDAITALLWRTLILTRVQTGELSATSSELSTFTVPHDSRRHLSLPKTWIGNCVYFIIAQASIAQIIAPAEESVPLLASLIRTALNRVDRSIVEGIMTIRRRDPYSLTWWPIMQTDKPEMVGITSLYHSEMMGRDWGNALGEVRHFGSTDIGAFGSAFQRAHFVGPKLDAEKGGCNVHVGLLEGEVQLFHEDETWKKFFELLYVDDKLDKRVQAL